jgi:hypothetical protein
MSAVKIIIYTASDGDFVQAARAAERLLSNPDFKNEGIVVGEKCAFYVFRNKSGSITVRAERAE